MENRNFKLILPLIILTMVVLSSCSKKPGEGGSSNIKGKVYAKYYNKTFTLLEGQGYAPDKDIYIIYGDEASYGDRTRTNYDGTYEFQFLRKGKYRIYVYSKDSTLTIPSGVNSIITDVEITGNRQTVIVPDLKIFD
ncbi:MAG: hypothetical protein HY951_10070 [Bacteroidia bacterium]|nr:hypothetical protein [Bacteroidia bacterium]